MALELRTYQQWVDWRRAVTLAADADVEPMIREAIEAVPGSAAVSHLTRALDEYALGWSPGVHIHDAQWAHFGHAP